MLAGWFERLNRGEPGLSLNDYGDTETIMTLESMCPLSVCWVFLYALTRGASYWTMHFDTAPRTLLSLNRLMRQDPRVVRWTVLKLGSRPEDIAREGQRALLGDKIDGMDP